MKMPEAGKTEVGACGASRKASYDRGFSQAERYPHSIYSLTYAANARAFW